MLSGSLVALVTPFLENGEVNYEKLEELIEYHLNNQTDGLVILGTTAEATTLSLEEQIRIVKLTVSLVKKRVPIIVGAGSNDTAKAMEKAKLFSGLGADYLLVITPYYNKTNQGGLIHHFESIAASSSVPIILYNVPSRTGMSISLHALEILSKNKNICGIKEASGNMSYAVSASRFLSKDFVMLSGNDDIIVPMMSIGATGVISVLANICPRETHKLCELCLKESYQEASRLQGRLLPVANALFYETNPIPVKAAMNHLGFSVGGYRMPLYSMQEEAYQKLIQILDKNKELLN
ncbi:MAG: 4-hydroxy-tetrahydrodipicolinate synthase [Anaeroplasmataceae bacterium]|nr:4-hydroxy-tetrahydrodipicolinate synthase [Anaeroplasmataceae bacterium]